MSTRVPSLTVRNLLNALIELVEWDLLGARLGIKRYKLQAIERNKRGDVAQCKLALFDQWLRSDTEASWEKLVQVLGEMGEDYKIMKANIQSKYIQGGVAAGGMQCPVGQPQAQSVNQSSLPRVESDHSQFGIRQPVVVEMNQPEEEIRRAQRLIDESSEGSPESRLIQTVSNFANSRFDFNEKTDDSGSALLHIASQRGNMDFVRALVAFGADVNLHNDLGLTPADVAKLAYQRDILKFLKKVGGKEKGEQRSANNVQLPIQEQNQPMDVENENADSMREEVFGGGGGGGQWILSLDYSSTMAIVQLEILSQIEKATGKKITELFQYIVASGVTGFLMMAMVYANKSLEELRRIYFRLRERVFSGQKPEERGKELERFAIEIFSNTNRMTDVLVVDAPRLLIGAVNKSSTILNPIFFDNFSNSDNSTMHVWKVARYTCSSPLYIGECDDYVDGGAIARNPSVFAFSTIGQHCAEISGVVSVGDGMMPGVRLGQLGRQNYHDHFHLSTANALSEQISQAFAGICVAGKIGYQRLNPLLDEYIPVPEEAKLGQLVNAVIHTITQCQKEDSDVQRFCRKFNNV